MGVLVRAEPATVGYHLAAIARRRDPELEAGHLAAAGTGTRPSPAALARMGQIIVWITAEHRFPRNRAENKEERSKARWLSDRRREAAEGTLHKAQRRPCTGPRMGQEPQGSGRGSQVARITRPARGLPRRRHQWPRHNKCDSEQEHTLGVWLRAQRQKRGLGETKLLDDAIPGWKKGRTRGRPRRR